MEDIVANSLTNLNNSNYSWCKIDTVFVFTQNVCVCAHFCFFLQHHYLMKTGLVWLLYQNTGIRQTALKSWKLGSMNVVDGT